MKQNKFKIIIFNFALISSLFAGAPDTLWTRTYGGVKYDRCFSGYITNDDGFILIGWTESFGSGKTDVYVVRVKSNGDTLWTKTYGGINYDMGNSVQQTKDGGFIITGETYSFDTSSSDIYLIRMDSLGDTLWTKTYGDTLAETGRSVKQTNDGGFVIIGCKERFIGQYGNEIYLLRTDALGDTLWAKTYISETQDNYGISVQHTNNWGFIITARSFQIDKGDDIYFFRTDSNGIVLWLENFGGIYNEMVSSSKQTNDKGFILTGYKEPLGGGYSDVYLIKTDSNGDSLWTKTYGGNGIDIGCFVQKAGDGGFIIAGTTSSFGAGLSDIYIIRTNSDGDTIWTKTCGGIGDENANSIEQTSDGGYLIAGETNSFGSGEDDFYLIRLDKDTTGIQEDNINNSLKPNNFLVSSSQGNISIRYTIPFSTRIKLEAFDIQGRLVEVIEDRFMQKGSYGVTWDAERFGAGIYFVRLSANGAEVSRKVTRLR